MSKDTIDIIKTLHSKNFVDGMIAHILLSDAYMQEIKNRMVPATVKMSVCIEGKHYSIIDVFKIIEKYLDNYVGKAAAEYVDSKFSNLNENITDIEGIIKKARLSILNKVCDDLNLSKEFILGEDYDC